MRPPPRSTLFPYTTLFRSVQRQRDLVQAIHEVLGGWRHDEFLAALPALRLAFTYFTRSEEHTSELQSHSDLVCRLLLEKKKSNDAAIALDAVLHPALAVRL